MSSQKELEITSEVVEGVEDEQDNGEILDPFNPAEIDIVSQNAVLGQLVDRIERRYHKEPSAYICLDPDFQRSENIWPLAQKSRLIESVLLGIPLPMFYVSAATNGVWDVVDGIQRLGAFRDFMLGREYLDSLASGFPRPELRGKGFKLEGLEFLTQFNGKQFVGDVATGLPGKQQEDLKGCNVQVTIIRPGTPDAVKFNIFKRINTGGSPLTTQEIRHALHQGAATEFLKQLTNLQEFFIATYGSVKDIRMEGRELVLRLLSTKILRWERTTSSKINTDNLLNETMRILNQMGGTPEPSRTPLLEYDKMVTLESLRTFFIISMERNRELFGSYAFRKSLPGAARRTQINKALFEMWGVILGELPEDQWENLLSQKTSVLSACSEAYRDEVFDKSVGQWASLSSVVKNRYDSIRNIIRNYT